MLSETSKFELIDFLESISLAKTKSFVPLVLVTTDSPQDLLNLLPEDIKSQTATLKVPLSSENPNEFVELLASLVEHRKYLLIEIANAVSDGDYVVLDRLSKDGVVDMSESVAGDSIEKKMSQDSLVILVGERSVLESQHGNLVNLSSYILEL